jgi:hypothetical protein
MKGKNEVKQFLGGIPDSRPYDHLSLIYQNHTATLLLHHGRNGLFGERNYKYDAAQLITNPFHNEVILSHTSSLCKPSH